ncbi:MAG TPA: hypothetical protein VGX68_00895 [Thermoanaerobaculia bacterium]|jgi:hypothetical protein|nr:hypothetical protein [Thermoanaerobaculia bacterium]
MRFRTNPWRAARALLLAAVCLAPAAGAADFSDNIKIASQYPSLQAAIDDAGETGMLIVDQDYQNLDPLVLPRRFRMMGMGPNGKAVLAFQGLHAGSAITIAGGAGDAWVVLEDLDIEGGYSPGNGFATTVRGIDLTGASVVFLHRLLVRGFFVGVYGAGAMSVHATNCSVAVSVTNNYEITGESHGWRVTGGLSSQAGRYGFLITADVNDTLIHGVRMESNTGAGIFTNGVGTHIANNRFECWVDPNIPFCQPATLAVDIGAQALATTLVDNLYAGIDIRDLSAAHTTYRFDNGKTVQINPPAGTDALTVSLAGSTTPEFLVDKNAWVRIGPQSGVPARLTVNAETGEDPLRVRAAGVTKFMVLSNGNVGVGTSVPAERLHVLGNLRLDGNLVSNGEICIGSGC